MVLGISLIFNIYRKESIIVFRLLLICFVLFHIWNNFIAGKKSCNCFGNLVEFDGIGMMIIILMLLFISMLPLNSTVDKNISISNQNKYSNKKMILVASMLFFILIDGYMRWVKIEKSINTGLISHTELPEVVDKLHSYLDSIYFDIYNDNTLFLFLRGSSCFNCIEELEFWEKAELSKKINIICVLPELPDNEEELLRNLAFKVVTIPKNIFIEIIGEHPATINRIFLHKSNSHLLAEASTDSYNEKISFLRKIEETIN